MHVSMCRWFSDSIISQGSVATCFNCCGYLVINLLEIYCEVWWQKNFDNRLECSKVMGKNIVAPFPEMVW